MKEVLILKELEQIKALSSPYRIQIVEAFNNKPANAKMIADVMLESHAKINYHIKALYKVGILDLVEEIPKSGIVEKFYQPVAKSFIVDSNSMRSTDNEMRDSLDQYRTAIFETISTTFYTAIEKKDRPLMKMQLSGDLYLTEQDVLEVFERFDALIMEVHETYKEKRPETNRYLVGNVLLPERDSKREGPKE